MIESGERSQSFGPLVVDYAQVQTKVGLKYDTWQSELQERFAALLSTAARDQLSALTAAKAQLEHAALEGGTADVIASVTCVQDMRRKARALQEQVSSGNALFSNACRSNASFSRHCRSAISIYCFHEHLVKLLQFLKESGAPCRMLMAQC
jgi:hypothetical protein